MTASTASELAYLSRALKAPRIRAVSGRLAERARDEGWDHETYLAAVLAEEVSAREGHGGEARVKAARFPAVKTIDDFDFKVQASVKREVIAHLAQLDFLAEAQDVVFLGPPGTGKTHLSIALAVQADIHDAEVARQREAASARDTSQSALLGALLYTDISVDFNDTEITGTATYSVNSGAQWDVSNWDEAFWAAGMTVVKEWTSPDEFEGYAAAGKIKLVTNSLTIQWISCDYIYEHGGIVA